MIEQPMTELSRRSDSVWASGPGHGVGGHSSGAAVFFSPTNSPTLSLPALDGGLPLTRARAAAHHGRALPRARRTATQRCGAWVNVYVQLAWPPFTRIRSACTRTREIG